MFKDELSLVPTKSGCYKMYNSNNVIIYVGKAKNLRNRLKSYFTGRTEGKTKKLVSEIDHFEYIVTFSELEAFILELNLIKKYNPKYNILLKDDKSYPYIALTNEKYSRLLVKRELNANKKKENLFGPYPNTYAARRIVRLLNRLYPLRKCENLPKKPCLYYHINECLGYCINKDVNDEKIKEEVISILNGNNEKLIEKIKEKIEFNSMNLNYEGALELKKELDYMNIVFERQKVELKKGINADVINYYFDKGYISIEVFFIRNGKLVGNTNNIIPLITEIKDELEYFIVDFYTKKNIVSKNLIVPSIIDESLLLGVLETKIIKPIKGEKKKLLDMCALNAKIALENDILMVFKKEERSFEANDKLKKMLNLETLNRIEAFDNSNLFGSFTVSGLVVFDNGVPNKKEYRKYKLSFEKNDDIKAMREVIYRRYFRLLKEHSIMPDLILVDGSINQINACKSVLNELSLNIKVCGIKKDKHHTMEALIDGDNLSEIKLDKKDNVFLLLTRIDDEVHRFTINYHKTLRSKSNISSLLDEIDGIGNKRKKELIKKYGSLKKLKDLPLSKLEKDLPKKIAENLYIFLQNYDK